MSRSQWCCLVAALAVVLGLFCGPATAAVRTAAAPTAPTAAPASSVVTAVAATTDGGHKVPGCGRGGKRDSTEPDVPGRARTAHDQAPGLAGWGLPVAIGPGPVRPPAPSTLRGPDAAAPTPVELSVLRV